MSKTITNPATIIAKIRDEIDRRVSVLSIQENDLNEQARMTRGIDRLYYESKALEYRAIWSELQDVDLWIADL